MFGQSVLDKNWYTYYLAELSKDTSTELAEACAASEKIPAKIVGREHPPTLSLKVEEIPGHLGRISNTRGRL